jgi:hypothetical protein
MEEAPAVTVYSKFKKISALITVPEVVPEREKTKKGS